jgi:hypothetical protein
MFISTNSNYFDPILKILSFADLKLCPMIRLSVIQNRRVPNHESEALYRSGSAFTYGSLACTESMGVMFEK